MTISPTIILGTTPTIRYVFKTVEVEDLAEAILTIQTHAGDEILRKTLRVNSTVVGTAIVGTSKVGVTGDGAVIGDNYIEWTLTQAETLAMSTKCHYHMMLNWLTKDGTRGASDEVAVRISDNHIREVMT